MSISDKVVASFRITENVLETHPIGTGHIHRSYRITTETNSYFLQQINHNVFPDVNGLMSNMVSVLEHLRNSPRMEEYEIPDLIPTDEGRYYSEIDGQYWRCSTFMAHLTSFDVPRSIDQVKQAAMAFSSFSDALGDFPQEKLQAVIPQFHSLRHRYHQLEEVRDAAPAGDAREWLTTIDTLYKKLILLEGGWETGELKTRIVHNDTKFNNVLFGEHGNARCVIDLDTVMRGILHFDLGDGLRTTANTAGEDERDLRKVSVNRQKYQAFVDGYLSGFKQSPITPAERTWLNYSGPYMALIMGMRFMTDFLTGSHYYPVDYPEHNLIRACNQICLAEEFVRLYPLDRS